MSQPSLDARAVVRAADAMTTQLRRIADALSTPTAVITDGVTTPLDDAPTTTVAPPRIAQWIKSPATESARTALEMLTKPEGCEQHPTAGSVGPYCLACTVVPPPARKIAHHVPAEAYTAWTEQEPAADEDQALRWARRESLLVLLSRLQRGRTLTEDEARTLRHHVETEMRDADTARATINRMRRTNRMVNGGARDSRERAERAEAAAEEQRRRADLAETELRTLRAGLRANGADPTQLQNLWAQISLRNRQWREAKREAALTRSMLEAEGGDVALVDEMLATVAKAEGDAREARAAIERVRALHTRQTVQTTGGPADACSSCELDSMSYPWPCPTAEALDGSEQPTP